jgi:pimeloyl-ACP methyl ester carboxylesterase
VQPETRYAKSGDVHIAYQVVGDGPLDLVAVPGWVSHLEYAWGYPPHVHFMQRLALFARLINFDKRGTGMSDRVADGALPTLEERIDDVRAVMDAVGSERAALLGTSEGGPMSILFAATYPERTSHLILYGSFPTRKWTPDYPWGLTDQERRQFLEFIERDWGKGADIGWRSPSLADDERARQAVATFERLAASPGAALTLLRMNFEIDVRAILPTIRVPTLVLDRVPARV